MQGLRRWAGDKRFFWLTLSPGRPRVGSGDWVAPAGGLWGARGRGVGARGCTSPSRDTGLQFTGSIRGAELSRAPWGQQGPTQGHTPAPASQCSQQGMTPRALLHHPSRASKPGLPPGCPRAQHPPRRWPLHGLVSVGGLGAQPGPRSPSGSFRVFPPPSLLPGSGDRVHGSPRAEESSERGRGPPARPRDSGTGKAGAPARRGRGAEAKGNIFFRSHHKFPEALTGSRKERRGSLPAPPNPGDPSDPGDPSVGLF